MLELGPNYGAAKYFINRRYIGEAIYTGMDVRALDYQKMIRSPHRMLIEDATKFSFPENEYDLILCNHVFSAIPNDRAAMKNLYRTLKPGGLAILNESPSAEEKSITKQEMMALHPEYSKEFFEDNGAAWYYGADYVKRLQDAGFTLEFLTPFAKMDSSFLEENGLSSDFLFYLGRKS